MPHGHHQNDESVVLDSRNDPVIAYSVAP
jgi:hypothetical protein